MSQEKVSTHSYLSQRKNQLKIVEQHLVNELVPMNSESCWANKPSTESELKVSPVDLLIAVIELSCNRTM